ncbi:MAG TPA: hypothetical protein VM553_08190 [Dongiaceae bacterium]|nr:hypothetical protein [Dongiaceae bacterium]
MKQQWKWAGVAVALMLVACGVKIRQAVWSAPFETRQASYNEKVTAVRELADGSLRVAYEQDRETLVVDTYDSTGILLQRQTFDDATAATRHAYNPPLFTSDDVVYFFGSNHADSVQVDLIAQTVAPLSDMLELALSEGETFAIYDTVVLSNGQLVLVGGDSDGGSVNAARVVVVNPDESVQTTVLDGAPTFLNVVARSGTANQYFVQSFYRAGTPAIGFARTYLGDGVTLSEQPAMNRGKLLHADLSGALASYDNNPGLFHYDANLQPDWENTQIAVPKALATSDHGYLLLNNKAVNAAALIKIDSQGAILWEQAVPLNVVRRGTVSEWNGKILISEYEFKQVPGLLTVDGEFRNIVTLSAPVTHRLLNANGKEQARFKEPALTTVAEWYPESGATGDELSNTPGTYTAGFTHWLANGNFVAVSDWSDQLTLFEYKQALLYFQLPD